MNTFTIQNILMPVDLSETSLNAIETAVSMAKKHNAVLHLLHVKETSPTQAELGIEQFTSHNADILSAIASAIRHQHELTPRLIETEGNVSDCIVKTALQIAADFIVMGTHGASGVRDGFVGTNTYNTIKHSTCPVLTVPAGRKITIFKKALFPVRPVTGALSNYAAVDSFLSSNATVDVLGISHRSDEKNSLFGKLVDEARSKLQWSEITTRIFRGQLAHAPETILQHAGQTKPDLLILTSALDPVAKADYIGPHTQKIIHEARVPVLIIKKATVPSLV